jgi:DNA-binding PadR family transcriptional regulator
MPGLPPVELFTLAALSDGPAHGYAIVVRIAELSDGRLEIRPGNLYRVLERLEDRGLIAESAAPAGELADERRRYFRITAAGRREAKDELAMYAGAARRSRNLREALDHG